MLENNSNSIIENEISIKDFVKFLRESWKYIFITGLAGLLGAIGFIVLVPAQYEAVAQVQMAQIVLNSNANLWGVNIEDPNLLMVRLKLPSSYESNEIKVCGLDGVKFPAESLANIVKLSQVKGISSVVELKIVMKSREQVVNCTQVIFEKIRDSQNNIIKSHVEEAKDLVLRYQKRLQDAQAMVFRADKSGSALSAAYLASRDEIKFLMDEISRLNMFIATSDSHQTKLVAPIYASDVPVFPKNKIVLMIGILAGILVGLLLSFIKKII